MRPARYVRVQLTSSGIALSLAEVRVLVPGSAIQQYYYAGGQRIAERVLRATGSSVLYYLAGDHLGSTSLTTCGSGCGTAGALLARQLYYPFGQIRYMTGTLPTDYGYTGQRLDDTGWMYYQARYYDPELARFTSADIVVPNSTNPQGLNRYSYVGNNPKKYVDPSGHCWGIASGLRETGAYGTTCNNLDMAWMIAMSPNAAAEDKLLAGSYI